MLRAVVESLSSCSAHGVGRVATSRSPLLRIVWLLLFAGSLCLFLINAKSLVAKLMSDSLSETYQLDSVDFQFPDLYFCPTNHHSGSFPNILNEEEAKEVNDEIQRVGEIYENVTAGTQFNQAAVLKAYMLHNSVSQNLMTKRLAHRVSQGVLVADIKSATEEVYVTVKDFSHPHAVNCFMVGLTDEQRKSMQWPGHQLLVTLMADPTFRDFNYTGYPIRPIVSRSTNTAHDFLDCDSYGCKYGVRSNGFKLIIVPKGAYPFFEYEKKFLVAPGHSYLVELKMSKYKYSKELYNSYCLSNKPEGSIVNPVTGKMENFTYRYAMCVRSAINTLYGKHFGCQQSAVPLLKDTVHLPRCLNVTTMSNKAYKMIENKTGGAKLFKSLLTQALKMCENKYPCEGVTYSTSSSFNKWPSVTGSSVKYFTELLVRGEKKPKQYPAFNQLYHVAKQLSNGSHSPHLEAVFRTFVAESFVQVGLTAETAASPLNMITPAYSVTSFLADTGGLLGLYIGCSVLTVCELLELFYHLITTALMVKRSRRGGGDGGETDRDTGDVEAIQLKQTLG